MAGQTNAIRVDKPSVAVDLPVPQPTMRRAIADLGRPGNVQLVLRDVTAQTHPGTLLDVYIAKKGDPASRQHVGTISWFGAFRHHGESTTVRKTYKYDITDELRALGAENAAEGVTVIVEASHGRMATPRAGAAAAPAEDASDDFRPGANVRIGAIELRSVAMNP